MKDPPENSRVITVVPTFAGWLIDTYNLGQGNRKKKPARIGRYAEAMGYNSWLLTGEPLIFSKDKLLDGQNRLMACVRSGKPFRTHVVFGIEPDVFAVINSGKSRTPGDTFYTAGVVSPEIVAQAMRWLMLYDAKQPMARTSFSNQDMWNVYCDKKTIDHDMLARAVTRAKAASKTVPRGALAAHFYLFEQSHPATAKKLATDFDKNQHGAKKLTTMLAKARKDKQSRLQDTWINAVLVQVWNAYRAGRGVTAKDLRWSGAAQDYPVIA